jgi:CheY-like chemotaxis protein
MRAVFTAALWHSTCPSSVGTHATPVAGEPGEPHMRPQRILIVDDMENQRRLLLRLLGEEHYVVTSAADGQEALDAIEASRPDLVLLDLMLPRVNGFEVCMRLKENKATRDLPIIVMTGLQHPANLIQCQQLGVTDVLLKPFTAARLLDSVRRTLGEPVQTEAS